MISDRWCYAVQILREDLTPVRQVPVTMDWDPLRECLRFVALQRGVPVDVALSLECAVAPIWSSERGQPYLEGVRGQGCIAEIGELSTEYTVGVFNGPARLAAADLVADGVLADGEVFRFLPVAFARAGGSETSSANGRLAARSVVPSLPIADGSLSSHMARAVGPLGSTADDAAECPVFIPEAILDEARTLAHEAEARETGGLLIGHLLRDDDANGLFMEVTAQLPALHVDANQTRLTFTSETWTEFRAALDLRRRGEIMLGWWHSHPVREWCKACPEEKQRVCSLRGDFLSEDDRLLHRAIFPRAYSLALVVNDVGYQEPTLSLFGWRRGLLSLRDYHVLDPTPRASLQSIDPEVLRAHA